MQRFRSGGFRPPRDPINRGKLLLTRREAGDAASRATPIGLLRATAAALICGGFFRRFLWCFHSIKIATAAPESNGSRVFCEHFAKKDSPPLGFILRNRFKENPGKTRVFWKSFVKDSENE